MIRLLAGRCSSLPLVNTQQQLLQIGGSAHQLSTSSTLDFQTTSDMKIFKRRKINKKAVESGSIHFTLMNKLIVYQKAQGKYRGRRFPVYSEEELNFKIYHVQPKKIHEHLARFLVRCMRTSFDIVSRYKGPGGKMTKKDWLNRCIFLETVAGIPGFVAGIHRHVNSLRRNRREFGWIPTLFEEAENERMHLLIFMSMMQPGTLFRVFVTITQGIFFNSFFVAYWLSPRTCHRFVGFLEEEAVHTYTGLVEDLRTSPILKKWANEEASLIARNYYRLPADATVLDVIRCIRTDESHHRDVNHQIASMRVLDDNPLKYKEKFEKFGQ